VSPLNSPARFVSLTPRAWVTPSSSHNTAWIRFTARACVLQSERHVNKMVLWPGCEGRAEFSLHTKNVRSVRFVVKRRGCCCNLSSGVALIVWFTTNGMCVKHNTIIYVARASNSKRDCEHDLYCCLLPLPSKLSENHLWCNNSVLIRRSQMKCIWFNNSVYDRIGKELEIWKVRFDRFQSTRRYPLFDSGPYFGNRWVKMIA